MTNSKMLCDILEEKGITKVKLASILGITRQGLHKKIKNISEFKQSEIVKISKVLILTKEQERDIFFTN